MNRLALISLAASALVPVSAVSAQRTVEPPVKWEDVPDVRLKVPGAQAPGVQTAPGLSWQQPRTAPVPRIETRALPAPRPAPQAVPPMRAAPVPPARVDGPVRVEMRPGDGHPQPFQREHRAATQDVLIRRDGRTPIAHGRERPDVRRNVIVRRHGAPIIGYRGINRYPHYRPIDRGHMLPHLWWGPRFHVMNWGAYGLPQPMHGGRWIRYYDDALLIDGHGRVLDGRWGMDWDGYDERWSYDEGGIPMFGGDGDFHPEDGRWAEEHYGPSGPVYHRQYAYPGYGYSYGYGGVVVTETTVTTSPTIIQTTVYEDVVQPARRAHRIKAKRVRSKTRCIC